MIGYGNTLRSDDGVGQRVAEQVARLNLPGVRAVSCTQLAPELAEAIAGAQRVVFVDAAVGAARRLRLSRLAASRRPGIPTHTACPQAVLALARVVFGRAPPAWLLAIPAETLALGQGLSPAARARAARAVERICRLAARGR